MKLVERLPNQRVDTGNKCRPAEVRDATVTAQMVNPNNELDSLSIDYEDMMKMAFMSGSIKLFLKFQSHSDSRVH